MIHAYVVAAAVAVLGGIVAVSARDARIVVVGLLVAMCAAQLASSPEPAVLAIVFRVLGSLLASYLLWAAARGRSIDAEGSGMGVMAECAVAAAAFTAGWFVVPVKPLAGPLVAQAAGIALIAISIVPLTGRGLLRVGVGATILVLGGSMLLQAWVGQPSSLWQISLTALLVGLVSATSVLISPLAGEAATLPVATGDYAANANLRAEHTAGVEPAAEAPAAAPAPRAARRAARKPRAAAADVAGGLLKAGGAPAEAAQVVAEPIPAAIGPTRTRVSRVRNAATRPLRGGPSADRPSGPAGSDTGTTPPDRDERPVPPANQVRRLRPREPRR
jgi:hypothetical protein